MPHPRLAGKFAREQVSQHLGDSYPPMDCREFDPAAKVERNIDRDLGGDQGVTRAARGRWFGDADRCDHGASGTTLGPSAKAFDLRRKRNDLGCGRLAVGHLVDEPTGASGAGEDDALAYARRERRWLMASECLRGLSGDCGAHGKAVEDVPRNEPGAEYPRLGGEQRDLHRRPCVERRCLRRDHDEIGGEQRGAHQRGNARRSIDQHMIDAASDLKPRKAETRSGRLAPRARPVGRTQ